MALLLSSAQSVSALFVGPSTIVINGAFTDWGSPVSGVYRHRDLTNTGISDGSGFSGTSADLNYFWNAMSTTLGGATSASSSNRILNIFYRIDTFTTGVIRPGQLYNIQLNLGTAPTGKADHLLQIWVDDRSTPQVTLVMYSYSTPYPAIGAYTSGTLTGRVSNVPSPYPGFSGALDTTASGAYGKYNGTNYGIEVKIPVAWFGSTYAGLLKDDGTGSPAYYGTIFTSTGTLGAVGTVKDTMNKSDGTPIYFVVDTSTGETNTEDLKSVNITSTKHVSLSSANLGDTLIYTVIVTNSGSSTANNVVFQDTITDPNLTWADSVTVVPSRAYVNSSNGVQVTIGNMAPGSSENITFRASIKNSLAPPATKVTNQGTVSGSNFASVPTDDPDTALASDATVTTILATPVYAVEPYKTWALTTDADHNGIPSPGDTLTYTITLENTGNQAATNVTFTDSPDPNSQLVAGSVTTTLGTVTRGNGAFDNSVLVTMAPASIPISTTVTVTFRVVVTSPLPAGVTQLSNQGFVSGDNFPVDPTDDPTDQSYDNPTVTPLTAAPLIEAYKRYELTGDLNGDGLPGPGDNLTYIITIANKGNQDATSVSFTDNPGIGTKLVVNSVIASQGSVTTGNNPGNTSVAVNVGTIPGGNSTVEISFKVTINSDTTGGISNQGRVTAYGGILVDTDDPNTHTVGDPTYTAIKDNPPHLSVTKSAILAIDSDNNTVPSPGDTLQYIVAINNNGGSAASNVTLTDLLDVNTTLVPLSTETSQTPVSVAETPSSVTVNIGILEAGTSHSICLITFQVTINNPFPVDKNSVSNQGTVAGSGSGGAISIDTVDPNTGGPTITNVYAAPVITATKADSIRDDVLPTGASPGDVLEYTVTITNSGTTTARNVVFQDTITDTNLTWCDNVTVVPARTFVNNSNGVQVNIDDLLAGNSVIMKFRAQIKNTPTKVTNQGTVSGSNFSSVPTDDPNTSIVNDPTSTAVSPTDMVEPYKTWALTNDADNNGYPSPGDNLTYTIRIENVGNQTAENVTFTDIPDPNSTLAAGSVTTTQGDIPAGMDNGDKSVTVHIGDIPQGTSENVTFIVTVNNPLPFGVTQLSNQGFVSGNHFPVDPTDDPTDQSYDNPTVTPLTAAPLIEAYKRYELTGDLIGDGLPGPGDNLTYLITIANKGNQNATGISFSDYFSSENITLVIGSRSTSQGTVISENSTGLAVNIGTIPGGNNTAEISFMVTINDGSEGGIYNQGTVTVSGLPSVLTDDPNTHTLNDPTYTAIKTSPPELRVTKSAVLADDADNNGVPSPGDILQYIVAINNNGGSAATDVVFTDTLDLNTALVSGSAKTSQGAVTETPSSITASIGTLQAGTSHSICLVTFQVTINNSFPVNTDSVSNQGTVTAAGPITVVTNDPNTDTPNDPTITTVYAYPLITATKHVVPPAPNPGDILTYTVIITNSGTTTASNVVFQDTLTDPNLTWADNVNIDPDRPNIISSNGIQVNIGNMAPGSSENITFSAQIKNTAGIDRVTNQGTVSGSNFSSVPTNDPDTALPNDPTNSTVSDSDRVEPFKSWELTNDADHNGYPSPGDNVTYTVVLENVGHGNALDVVFTDIPDPNSTLVAGSVTTSGMVTKGNTPGDKSVIVDAGDMIQGAAVTITFIVTVNNPLPFGVTQLSNQGFVSGSNFAVDPTDDPTDQAYDNPTVTPITAAPLIEAYKRYELTDDVTNDGLPGPGDNLTYFITIANKGNQDATGVIFNDLVNTKTTLVVGTAIASQGTVISENSTGLTVNIGTITGGNNAVTISFKVTIKDGSEGGIYNQGTVILDGPDPDRPISVATDDPNTHTVGDPTYTAIGQAPANLVVTKSAVLATDADNNGVPSPGDTLQYIVAINNNGGSAATAVAFTDTLDPNTALVLTSTKTGQTTATITETSSSVTVDIGTLEAGTSHSICLVTFMVTISNPLPAGINVISNQGTVTATGSGGPILVVTDDPNTAVPNDATLTTAYAPVINATKTVDIAIDADSDGVPSPGDTLAYTVILSNRGDAIAKSVYFQDSVAAPGLTLAGLMTTQGDVITGNTSGDKEVQVDVGDIPAGGSVIITIWAKIDTTLPDGVNHFSNQGYVRGANFSVTPTDDPSTSLINDATSTPVTAIPFVEPYKTWALTTDADHNGYPSPGDTITYTVIIENSGNQDATGVTFTDVPAPYSTLVAGSVTTTLGTVTTGNVSGDSSVLINIDTLPGGHDSATITFQVRVTSPLPTGTTQLSNQGFASGRNFPSDPTDDPTDQAYDNPTVTLLSATPLIMTTKSCELSGDANQDGLPDPGDNLTYIINIYNNGNQDATGIQFDDTPDANTTLFAGSVRTSNGSVTTGNTAGNTRVTVNIDTLPGEGGFATISFKVKIKDTLGLMLISNQGRVTGSNFTRVYTDDPGTTRQNDATETYMAADSAPSLQVTKAAILSSDNDHTGLPSPGDTIQYIVTINNTGNGKAENIVFTDTPDPNTTLVAGSVSATEGGNIISGNSAGDRSVNVGIAVLPGGTAHSVCLVTFTVRVNSPFPAGVSSISNQGHITADGGIAKNTEDPGTAAPNSPTVTTIYPGPAVPPTPPSPQPVHPTPMPSHSSTMIGVGDRPWQPNLSKSPTTAVTGKPVDLSNFKSSNLVIRETEDGHIIYVDVTNSGQAAGTYTLKLKINGSTQEVKYVRLDPSKSAQVQWFISSGEPGIYSVTIDGLSGTYFVDGLKGANRLINPDAALMTGMALILAALLLAVVYVWRRRQYW